MNRYIAAGLLADLRAGRRIAVLSGTQAEARVAFTEVAAHAADGERIRRTNGEERVSATDGPGWIAFGSSAGRRFRGITADIVLFDAHKPGREAVEEALLIIAAAPQGELIRM